MEFKDHYATLGVERTATQAVIKRAYRKLARKYHPDVSKEPDAEARFKDVAEAHETLIDTERRAAYDDLAQRPASRPGRAASEPAGPDSDDAASSDFFTSVFGRGGPDDPRRRNAGSGPVQGRDHHAQVAIGLLDACHGARRMVSLHMPVVDAAGRSSLQERRLEVHIPKGVREGQHLRLAGQGAQGQGGGPAGDLYLDLRFLPHPVFRVDGGDLSFDLPVAPWEAALGATVTAPTPDGEVALTVPAGSPHGRRLRLKGKGLPGKVPGDLYAVLSIVLPAAVSASEKEAYAAFAHAFAAYDPRAALAA